MKIKKILLSGILAAAGMTALVSCGGQAGLPTNSSSVVNPTDSKVVNPTDTEKTSTVKSESQSSDASVTPATPTNTSEQGSGSAATDTTDTAPAVQKLLTDEFCDNLTTASKNGISFDLSSLSLDINNSNGSFSIDRAYVCMIDDEIKLYVDLTMNLYSRTIKIKALFEDDVLYGSTVTTEEKEIDYYSNDDYDFILGEQISVSRCSWCNRCIT